MCGIVGKIGISKTNQPLHQTIAHRGPDDFGIYNEGIITLEHRRLSIVDISLNGHQPMISQDSNFVLCFNGEIYNHLEIRKKLISKGYIFKSTSDTETLLYGFIEFGIDIVKQLNGIFAFVIFDKIKNELFIVRDHYGVKPLYYYNKNNLFLFASEIKAFLDVEGFDKTINETALFNYIQLLYAPAELTPFKNVQKLLPGHYLKIEINQNKKTYLCSKPIQYYSIPFNGEYENYSETEWIQKLDEALQKAVDRQLMSDVPLGFFLSGGLDSSLITAIAKAQNPNLNLNCFTIETGELMKKEGFADDLVYAKKMANHLDAKLEIIPANKNILKLFDNMIWHLDEPLADPAPMHVLNICDGARKQGIKVLLGGTAGDDLFSGYRRHQALNLEKYFKYYPKSVAQFINAGIQLLPSNNVNIRRLKKISNESTKSVENRMASYFHWYSSKEINKLFTNKSISNINPNEIPINHFKNLLSKIPNEKNELNQMLFWELNTFLPDHNLNYTDKMSMAVGVETRVPFLDVELVNLTTKIPPNLKMKGVETKYLLKKVAEKYLPKEVIYRPKTGFGAPIRSWIKNEFKSKINDSLNIKKIGERGIFNSSEIEKLIQKNNSNKIDAAYTIWSLLSIESWMQQFIDK